MSPPARAVETHERREEIDAALEAGTPGREVARRFGISEAAVRRYRSRQDSDHHDEGGWMRERRAYSGARERLEALEDEQVTIDRRIAAHAGEPKAVRELAARKLVLPVLVRQATREVLRAEGAFMGAVIPELEEREKEARDNLRAVRERSQGVARWLVQPTHQTEAQNAAREAIDAKNRARQRRDLSTHRLWEMDQEEQATEERARKRLDLARKERREEADAFVEMADPGRIGRLIEWAKEVASREVSEQNERAGLGGHYTPQGGALRRDQLEVWGTETDPAVQEAEVMSRG